MLRAIEISAHMRVIYFYVARESLVRFIVGFLICVESDISLCCVIKIKRNYMYESIFP